jgi:hypothetical protein
MSRSSPSILFGLSVPLLLLVILIEIIWFSCITLFGGGNPGGAVVVDGDERRVG